MPRLFTILALASFACFIAAGSPVVHFLAIAAFAVLLSRLAGHPGYVVALLAVVPFVGRLLLAFTGTSIGVDDWWPASAGSALPLHHGLAIVCLLTVFAVTHVDAQAAFTDHEPTNQHIAAPEPWPKPNHLVASCQPSPSPSSYVVHPGRTDGPASELLKTGEPDDCGFEVSIAPSHRTTSEQKTQFIFPLTASKSAHLAYDLDPDEVLSDLAARMSLEELLDHLARAEITVPESILLQGSHSPPAAEMIKSLIQADVLTQYQAMLIGCGLPDLLNVGPYQVIERIGRGGMAIVLRVRDRHTKHIYALKLLAKLGSLNDVLRHRFLREMDAVCELAHPNIAVARTVGQHDQFLYIAMEWVQGCNLAQYVFDKGPLPPAMAIDFIRQASEALQYAHERGLVHRDVKPANLILSPGGEIKLVDMGLARFVDAMEQNQEGHANRWRTDTGHLMGTIDYMAPEQAVDLSHADQRSDIYSLGCTLFYLLTGETHLRGNTQRRRAISLVNQSGMRELRDVNASLDPALYALVKKMIKISPQERFQSVKELLVAIDDCAVQFGLPSQLDKAYRVLVVEDSTTQALITCEQLRATSRHFIPVDVATLASACDRLRSQAFDIVLLDLNLPDSSGIETILALRQVHESVPVLVLTSNNDPAAGVKCIEAGADDFLPKDALDVLTLERHILLTLSRRQIPVP